MFIATSVELIAGHGEDGAAPAGGEPEALLEMEGEGREEHAEDDGEDGGAAEQRRPQHRGPQQRDRVAQLTAQVGGLLGLVVVEQHRRSLRPWRSRSRRGRTRPASS